MPSRSYEAALLRALFYVKRAKISTPWCWHGRVPADAYIIDFEDAVPASEKVKARAEFQTMLNHIPRNAAQKLLVRVNNLTDSHTEWLEDMQLINDRRVYGIILPKVSVHDIKETEAALDLVQKTQEHKTRLFPMIECANGVLDAANIAASSKRISAIMLGRYDLTNSLCCSSDGKLLEHAYSEIVMAACSANVRAIASVNCSLKAHTLYEDECRSLADLGFAGRSVLTNAQAVMARRAFTIRGSEQTDGKEPVKLKVSNGTMSGPPHAKKEEYMAVWAGIQARHDAAVRGTSKGKVLRPQLLRPVVKGLQKDGWLESPFTARVSDGVISVWEQHFLANSTSEEEVPFSLLLNLAMSHSVVVFSYAAKAHLETVSAQQHRAVQVGERLKNRVQVVNVEEKGKKGKIVTSQHQLVDSSEKPVFSVTKKTLFPEDWNDDGSFEITQPDETPQSEDPEPTTSAIQATPLKEGQMVVHEMVKAFGPNDAVSLSYLLKGLNPLHVNSLRFSKHDLMISGPCVLAATLANQGLDFGELRGQQLHCVKSPNKTNNGDLVATLSYVKSIKDMPNDTERVTVFNLGVRNLDPLDLSRVDVPASLLDTSLKPKDIEAICAVECPDLTHRIVVHGEHSFVRAKPKL